MRDNTQELREAVKDGLANHTGEFANPWIFKGHYSHELLADILNDIMASERLFKNLEALIKSQTNQAVLEARIDELNYMIEDMNVQQDSWEWEHFANRKATLRQELTQEVQTDE